MLLSDKEIDAIEAKCWASLESDNPICFSRAIESAVLAKLQEQEPVCWYYYGENGKKYYCEDAGYLDLRHPLYAFPQPAVEQDDRRDAEINDLGERLMVSDYENKDLREQIKVLKKDAERYRWLRSNSRNDQLYTAANSMACLVRSDKLDAAIDSAMAQGEKK